MHEKVLFCLLMLSIFLAFVLPQAIAHQIPRQIIFTGKPDRLHDMPKELQVNVQKTAGWHPRSNDTNPIHGRLRPRWFGDAACHQYIKKHFDEELLGMFDNASPGNYRGDICRAAILFREGGFYADVDLQMAVPLESIVDERTTFASVHSIKGDIFNGLLAVVPESEVMGEALKEIRKWYRGETPQTNLMGTMTLKRAIENVMATSCPSLNLTETERKLQWTCGPHTIRLYRESDLLCFMKKGRPQPFECPIARKRGALIMRYGFFNPEERVNFRRKIIAWPKLLSCKHPDMGCDSGGHDTGVASFLSEVQIASGGAVHKRPSFMRLESAAR